LLRLHAGLGITGMALMMSLAAVRVTASVEPLRIGEPLPPLEGEYLTEKSAMLPAAGSGKTTLILMGFTYASRVPVEAWGQWFRDTIGVGPDRTFFEVPMMGGMAKMGRWFIDRGMRKGTPPALHENVITVYANTGDWKKRLAVSSLNDKDAFLIVLDRDGRVQWLHHGPFEAARAQELMTVWADVHQ
jgi:hypothetical protein